MWKGPPAVQQPGVGAPEELGKVRAGQRGRGLGEGALLLVLLSVPVMTLRQKTASLPQAAIGVTMAGVGTVGPSLP